MSTDSKNTTDAAIGRVEAIIISHTKDANRLLLIIISISFFFLAAVFLPILKNYLNVNKTYTSVDGNNSFIEKVNQIKGISVKQYDTLVTKAIFYQKLLNTNHEATLSADKLIAPVQKQDLSDYVLYGVFILIFGVTTSLYRFHLKEISKQEHYLVGFQRIRIAGVNSTTKYDDEVKVSLTKDAFTFNENAPRKDKLIESPIPGHPSSDIATELLNKLLDKFDLTAKKE
jgi:hypothetical protein